MEKKVIITKRFRKNTYHVYKYIVEEFSPGAAYNFLLRLEKRIDFITNNPTVGKSSAKRKNIRSILFTPHNQLFTGIKMKLSRYFVFLTCERILKKDLTENKINIELAVILTYPQSNEN